MGNERVLVAVDGSERSKEVLVYALENCADKEIAVVHVPVTTTEDLFSNEKSGEIAKRRGGRILEEAAEIAEEHGKDIETELVHGDIANAVVSYADESGADRVIVGSHGRDGAKRVLLGSVAENLARRAPCPVTVVR